MAGIVLHLTCDHEIFGNGSGCIDRCMIDPGEQLMTHCEEVGARMTFFVDVCEYWAFREVQDNGGFGKDDPADRLEKHFKEIIKRGHQVQLHFHPQWLHYEYKGEGEWNLDHRMWRLPEVDKYWEEGGEEPLKELFKRGKKTLEDMLREVDEDYECTGFRAGAWSIQPEGKVLEAMKECGFKMDSTVAPGKFLQEDLTWYDFKNCPDKAYWKIGQKVDAEDPDGTMIEYPIFTLPLSGFQNGKFTLAKLKRQVPFKPGGCVGSAISGKKDGKVKKLKQAFTRGFRMFNFTDGATFEEMKFMAERAVKKYQRFDERTPVIAIGHSKTFGNRAEFQRFLEWGSKAEDVTFSKGI